MESLGRPRDFENFETTPPRREINSWLHPWNILRHLFLATFLKHSVNPKRSHEFGGSALAAILLDCGAERFHEFGNSILGCIPAGSCIPRIREICFWLHSCTNPWDRMAGNGGQAAVNQEAAPRNRKRKKLGASNKRRGDNEASRRPEHRQKESGKTQQFRGGQQA